MVEGWFGVRPDAAADYVLQLPAGVDRDKLVDALSWSFIHQSPSQAGPWYRRLSPAEQSTFRTAIERSGLHSDRRQKLDAAMKGE